MVLGMARRDAAPATKPAQLLERYVVSRQVERRVLQDGRVAGREDKAVAVDPVGVRRIVTQVSGPQHVRERRERHGGARVPGSRVLYGVHGQGADGVDG